MTITELDLRNICLQIQQKITHIEMHENTKGDDLDIGAINGLHHALNIINDFYTEKMRKNND